MALSDNPFALLNPGPLPARIPNSFGPPPGTIMPNNYDRVKAVLDAQAAAYASQGQANPNPFTAQQIFQQFPGPSLAQQARTQEQRIGNILADQQAGAAMHNQTLTQPFTASQIMQQFPANVHPYPQDVSTTLSAPAPLSLSPIGRATKATTPYAQDLMKRVFNQPNVLSSLSSQNVIPGTNGTTSSSMRGWGRNTMGGK